MTTDDIILHVFYLVATILPAIAWHPQANLYLTHGLVPHGSSRCRSLPDEHR